MKVLTLKVTCCSANTAMATIAVRYQKTGPDRINVEVFAELLVVDQICAQLFYSKPGQTCAVGMIVYRLCRFN